MHERRFSAAVSLIIIKLHLALVVVAEVGVSKGGKATVDGRQSLLVPDIGHRRLAQVVENAVQLVGKSGWRESAWIKSPAVQQLQVRLEGVGHRGAGGRGALTHAGRQQRREGGRAEAGSAQRRGVAPLGAHTGRGRARTAPGRLLALTGCCLVSRSNTSSSTNLKYEQNKWLKLLKYVNNMYANSCGCSLMWKIEKCVILAH